jgi:hypothetical protein
MKMLLKIVGGILVCLALVLVVLRITGLNPHDGIPGLWLTGDLVTTPVTDWSSTDKVSTIKLQTQGRLLLPHSVTLIVSPTIASFTLLPFILQDRREAGTRM